jgi:hypothetical protein
VRIIEMTLAEKMVTACINRLQQENAFHDYWHGIGRNRDQIMNDMRREAQYVLDHELLAQMPVGGIPREDAGSGGIPTGPQILVNKGSDRLDGGGLPKEDWEHVTVVSEPDPAQADAVCHSHDPV